MSADDFDAGMGRIEELVQRAETECAKDSLPLVRDLVRALLDVHRIGLGELIAALETGGTSGAPELVRIVRSRPAVASLLAMHDLHPESVEARVQRALREANDVAGGRAEASLVRADGADVVVSVSGSGQSAELLVKTAERLVCEYAPDATLHVEKHFEPDPRANAAPNLVPLSRLRAGAGGAR
ncbi:MAG TPA: hypothetical protein VH062_31195 [Polyangiaceae bacterium]|jgi:hypothetical protein|nr:hypothetical protein [Polyangiaceae bacterium]